MPAVRGELLLRAGRPGDAAAALRAALDLVVAPAERALLEERLAAARAAGA